MKTRLLFFLLLITLWAEAQNKEQVKAVVYRWNSLHNTTATEGFKNLYAPTVLFYGRYTGRQKCYEKKERFLSPDFRQEIIAPVILTVYVSGTVKCDFKKRVTYRNLVKEHDCYLLVQEQNGRYLVTGESEREIDSALGVQLALGAVVSSDARPFNPVPLIAIGGGLFVLLLLVLVIRRRRKAPPAVADAAPPPPMPPAVEPEPEPAETIAPPPPPAIATIPEPPKPEAVVTAPEPASRLTEKEKGDAFERFVVAKFAKEYFELVEWRSDKYHDGVYALSSTLPDLEYRFKTSAYHFKIAVECKWRAAFIIGRVEWAKSHQLVTYRQYEKERGIPVFVVIGVGGVPAHPAAVYIVPLSTIRSNVLSEVQLQKYLRHRTGNFFLDAETMVLE